MSQGLPRWISSLDGTDEEPSTFSSGPALFVAGREILHVDADGSFDIRLTRQIIRSMRDELAADARVHRRPSTSADWISVEATGPKGRQRVLELATRAVEANRRAG